MAGGATPAQFGTFLDAAESDRLYALFHLVGTRGLRGGEAVGQSWTDVDLNAGLITPAKEIVVDGWDTYESAPKTDGSASTIALDSVNVALLREHHKAMLSAREKWGDAWNETGKVFTREDGSWLHPETVSETFRRILATTDLPPITLRDLLTSRPLSPTAGVVTSTRSRRRCATPRSRSRRTRTRACCPRSTKPRQKPPPHWCHVPVRAPP